MQQLSASAYRGFRTFNTISSHHDDGVSLDTIADWVASAGYELQLQLRDFQAEYFQGATTPEVRVRLSVTLVRLGPLAPVGQKVVEAKVRANSANIGAVITAFDQAVHDALTETVTWTTGQLAAKP